MYVNKSRKSLNRPFIQLAIITFAVVITTIVVNVVSWNSTQSVSSITNQLVNESVPQLKVISNLENNVNQRILQLYIYYSTYDTKHWDIFMSLHDEFIEQCTGLIQGNSIFNYHEALLASNTDLNNSAMLLHKEMQKDSSRDWNKLHEHLKSAQSDTNHIIYALDVASDVTREATVESTKATLTEVLNLKSIQLGFSISVVLVAGTLIVMLRGRLLDQKELYKRAYFDNLTELPNRKQLEDDWSNDKKNNTPSSLLFIKLDHYHLIASTFGHTVADHAALQITDRLKAVIESSTHEINLYQFTNSTWLLVINNDPQNSSTTSFAQKVLSITADESLLLDGSDLSVTCSIGIAIYPTHGQSIGELLRNADSALFESQKNGRNTYTIFHPRIKNKIDKLLAMECNLRDALHRNEFELYFQPKIDVANQTISSAEALIRWHYNGQTVSPVDFIPIAERSNLILDIGNWVIDEACHQMNKWRSTEFTANKIAVNISPKHFLAPEFVDTVQNALDRHNLPAECLEIEITEEAMMHNPDTVINRLHELKNIGVIISIDDFGTGYSSLAYIRSLPIDAIKIDKSFIDAMLNSNNDLVIVQMIIQLAKKLNLEVIAEGVETERQQEILTRYKCNYLQGYLFSKPLSIENYEQYLDQSNSFLQPVKKTTSLH